LNVRYSNYQEKKDKKQKEKICSPSEWLSTDVMFTNAR
jgi:hypothetical protein